MNHYVGMWVWDETSAPPPPPPPPPSVVVSRKITRSVQHAIPFIIYTMVWVWYTIVEKSSQNAGGVYLRDDAPIVELMKAVAAENTYAMARNCADPQDLVLYLSKSDLESQNPVISKSDTISKISSGRQADEIFYILIRDRTADTLSATTVKLTGFDFLRKLVFYTENRGCVTALNQRKLVTFAHGHHSSLKISTFFPCLVINLASL